MESTNAGSNILKIKARDDDKDVVTYVLLSERFVVLRHHRYKLGNDSADRAYFAVNLEGVISLSRPVHGREQKIYQVMATL